MKILFSLWRISVCFFYDSNAERMSALVTSGVLRAPRTPCGRGSGPCTCFGRRRRPRPGDKTVCHTIWRLLLIQPPTTLKTPLFCPMRLPSLDSGRLFSAKIAFRNQPLVRLYAGDFAEPFSAAPARFFTSAQVFTRSRPVRGYALLNPRQGRGPCTCPASPFTAKPGLCFSRRLATEKQTLLLS